MNSLSRSRIGWIKNRRGAQWNSTRDTAIALLALNDYLRVSGELKTDIEYEVFVNGASIAKKKISGADIFNAPSRFRSEFETDSGQQRGPHRAPERGWPGLFCGGSEILQHGRADNAGWQWGIFVKTRVLQTGGAADTAEGTRLRQGEPLRDGGTVKSGERVETVLTIEGKNDCEYLLFEDLKPAGLEAVEACAAANRFTRRN